MAPRGRANKPGHDSMDTSKHLKRNETQEICLDYSIRPLIEPMARNFHNKWIHQPSKTFDNFEGESNLLRGKHKHPRPYNQLSETEKIYSRKASEDTLRLILKLGYQIIPTEISSSRTADQNLIADTLVRIESASQNLSGLVQIWHSHVGELWAPYPELYAILGREFLKRGEPLLAYDVFACGLTQLPDIAVMTEEQQSLQIQLSQQQALALSETGALKEAAEILHELLRQRDQPSPETLGLLGRTYKEMAQGTDVSTIRIRFLNQAYEAYYDAYQRSASNEDWEFAYYTGINAASVSKMFGDELQTKILANEVRILCRKLLEGQSNAQGHHWLFASLGEAELLCGNVTQAHSAYLKAVRACQDDQRALMSMRRQLLWISEFVDISTESLLKLFPVPTIVIFSGHRVDDHDSGESRLPAANEPAICDAISRWLSNFNQIIAYCSAANGSDLIFIEQILALGGEVNIVLPFNRKEFLETSVETAESNLWCKRYEDALAQATRVIELAAYHPDVASHSFDFANLNILGMAQARSESTGFGLEALAVWNGCDSKSIGGTFTAIQHWSRADIPITHINSLSLTTARLLLPPNESTLLGPIALPSGVNFYNYLPMLFADVKGYSNLDEAQLVAFSTHFMNCLKDVRDQFRHSIFSCRTQGDGLFVVFRELSVAASFALALNRTVNGRDWESLGLPKDLKIRVALDAGPCFSYLEPISKIKEFCGHYVNRAARMEPITPPGHIYASENFVALAKANKVNKLRFVYAGRVVLPKDYGVIPAYLLKSLD